MMPDDDKNRQERQFLAEVEDDEETASKVSENQLANFTEDNDKCAGVQLPKGVMLRYNLAESLYFYLETNVDGGRLKTVVF
ncbi:MAG: hypothetical protein N2C14_01065, partial [Planctomycetales bacterium]